MRIEEVKNRKIILDSNIPIHYAHKGFVERSGNPLRTLLNNGNTIGIPAVVGFEILAGDNTPETRDKYLKFLNHLPTLELTRGHFQNAAILAAEYRRIYKGKSPPVCDLLIGGLIASYSYYSDEKPLLFTCDRNDFCEPLWNTVAHVAVPSGKDNQIQEHLYLLELNTDMLDQNIRVRPRNAARSNS